MSPIPLDDGATAVVSLTSRRGALPLEARHEQLEEMHLAIANLAQESVSAPREEIEHASLDPDHAHLARALDELSTTLRRARRVFDALLDAMPAAERRDQLQAIAMLSRQHDEAARDLHEAQLALLEGSAVAVRIRLARVFRAIGRAEQMHFYLRSPRAARG